MREHWESKSWRTLAETFEGETLDTYLVSTCYVPNTVLGNGIKNKSSRWTLETMVTQVLKAGNTGNYQSIGRASHRTAPVHGSVL